MTNEQIKQLMHESRAVEWFNSDSMDWLEYVNVFDRFASLVVAAEREACAKVCDAEADEMTEGEWTSCAIYLANNIRARREK
jgi:hypothetical protein